MPPSQRSCTFCPSPSREIPPIHRLPQGRKREESPPEEAPLTAELTASEIEHFQEEKCFSNSTVLKLGKSRLDSQSRLKRRQGKSRGGNQG